jgi:hypothetical protein
MTSIPVSPTNDPSEARRQVEAYCQSLVVAGVAQWRINDAGYAELHMGNGETYLLGDLGITRLR